MNCPHCGDEACELGYACPKNANRERAADGDYVMQSFIKEALEDDAAAKRCCVCKQQCLPDAPPPYNERWSWGPDGMHVHARCEGEFRRKMGRTTT